MSEDCQDREDEHQNFPDDAEGVAFMVNNSSSSSEYNELFRMIWYVDSGASDHLTNDIQVLEDVKELEKPIKIGAAKAEEDLEGTHVGSIRVSNNVDGRIHSYTLLDVIYVPNLRKNLLSVGKIEKKGFKVDFYNQQILIMKGNEILVKGYRKGTLYEVDFGVNVRLSDSYICSRAAKAEEDLEGTHVGSIRVSNNVDGRIHSYTLLDVIYVPNLRKNLLSVGKIEKKGFKVDFYNQQILIMKGNEILVKGYRKGTLYEVDFGVNLRLSDSYICSRNKNMLWHQEKSIKVGRDVIFDETSSEEKRCQIIKYPFITDISHLTNSSTQVSPSTETNDSTFEEEEKIDTETEAVENVSPVTNEVDATRDRNQEKKCSSRSRQLRLWLNDYEENYVAGSSNNIFSIAYSTESFKNNLPRSIDNVKSHPDRKQWEDEMLEELKSLEENKTWTLVPRTEKHKRGILKINRTHYIIKMLEKFGMSDCSSVRTPMEFNLKLNHDGALTQNPFKEAIGCLMYLMVILDLI
ncbi:hypothetical protein JTB14_024765 [Gonioctena quinquepunctata]|nr:hypothetical protein JTB14_024765 [Gonioctena quinquepunctata]